MVIVDTEDVIGLNKLRKLPQLLSPLKLLPTSGSGFLGFAPLRVGITVLTCYYLITALSSLLYNLMLYESTMSFGYLLMYIFNIYILMTWGYAAFGLLMGKYLLIKQALVMWTIFIITWILVIAFSFTEYGNTILCVDSRCSESLWMYKNMWHDINDPMPQFRPPLPKDNIMELLRDTKEVISHSDLQSKPTILTKFKDLAIEVEGKRSSKEKAKSAKLKKDQDHNQEKDIVKLISSFGKIGADDLKSAYRTSLVILIIMILYNSVILIYSWYILLGYYAEAKCIAECMCDEEERNISRARKLARR